jgi:hypothetical protein
MFLFHLYCPLENKSFITGLTNYIFQLSIFTLYISTLDKSSSKLTNAFHITYVYLPLTYVESKLPGYAIIKLFLTKPFLTRLTFIMRFAIAYVNIEKGSSKMSLPLLSKQLIDIYSFQPNDFYFQGFVSLVKDSRSIISQERAKNIREN